MHSQLQRQYLPIAKHRSQLLYAVENYSIVVVVGETGSGKSTQIPQYLYENGWCDDGFSIVCTQPRRIAAQTLAQRVSTELQCPLGTTVGYTIRFDDKTTPSTAIRYVTDGTLLREATLSDPLLSRYSVIMMDEAHERNLNSDALLGILKKIRRKRLDLRIVVCSATIDAQAFLDFFISPSLLVSTISPVCNNDNDNHDDDNPSNATQVSRKRKSRWGDVQSLSSTNEEKKYTITSLPNVDQTANIQNHGTIISIDGRLHPVDILYTQEPLGNYIEATVDTALRIHYDLQSSETGDILCFLPTAEDIDKAILLAEEYISSQSKQEINSSHHRHSKHFDSIVCLPLYASLPYSMQSKIFSTGISNSSSRRIIFATNIAETSVTVPNITSVIDSGFVKLPYFDPKTGLDRLIISPISKASARQRAGRAGRIQPGKCYRLYTEAFMLKKMLDTTPPEILRTNLSSFILTLKALGIHNILSFDLMDIPSVPALCHGLESLHALGAIDDDTNLTKLGYQMAEFPSEPRVSRMILESLQYSCVKNIVSVAATMQVRNLMYIPKNARQQQEYDVAIREILDKSGDHVTMANLMEYNDRTRLSQEDCKSLYVNHVGLRKAKEIQTQLFKFVKRYMKNDNNTTSSTKWNDFHDTSDMISSEARSTAIRKSVTAGFFSNVAKLANDGYYYTLRGHIRIIISNSSVLFRHGSSSEYMLFGETFDGIKGGMEVRFCSAIEGQWLRDVAPHYFE